MFFASVQSRALPKAVALVPCLQLGHLVKSLEDFKVGEGEGGGRA